MSEAEEMLYKTENYIVHDFLIGNPVLINRHDKTLTFFHHNIYGQLYDLTSAEPKHIGPNIMQGLIRRTRNPNYDLWTQKVVDSYIYAYLMTPGQRALCQRKPHEYNLKDCIAASNDYSEVVQKMCEWVYEHEYSLQLGGKEERREELLQYYKKYLANHQVEPVTPHFPAKKKPASRKNGARAGTSR